MIFDYQSNHGMMLRSVKVHLYLQLVIAAVVLYGIYHFIRIKKVALAMRKAPGEQREIKSKRIEILIFGLLLALLFISLFYTVPGRRYNTNLLEDIVYLTNLGLEFLMLASLFSSHNEANRAYIKSKQRYAIAGGIAGLLIYYTYYQFV